MRVDNTTRQNYTKSMARILIIEDDTYTREIYEDVLTSEGFNVVTAADGEEGLVKAREGGFNLILLDVMMPKMDGMAVLTALQKQPPFVPNGPIILLTNLMQEQMSKEAVAKGAKAYLVKSNLTPGELVEHVKAFLS